MQQGSAAFNISRERAKEQQYGPKVKVILNEKQKTQAKSKADIFKSLVMIVSVLIVVVSMINFRVQLTELTGQIEKQRAVLAMTQTEGEGLVGKLNNAKALQNVEMQARENLGMAKLESYQVKYITLEQNDSIKVSKTEDSVIKGIEEHISDFLAYLRG